MSKINRRRFKRARSDRVQFKRNQNKLWLTRIKNVAGCKLSKKVKAQLGTLDPKSLLFLSLHKSSLNL